MGEDQQFPKPNIGRDMLNGVPSDGGPSGQHSSSDTQGISQTSKSSLSSSTESDLPKDIQKFVSEHLQESDASSQNLPHSITEDILAQLSAESSPSQHSKLSQEQPHSKEEKSKYCDNKTVPIPKELKPPVCPLSISMKAAEILTTCKGLGKSGITISMLVTEDGSPPQPPRAPFPPLPKESLNPPTPSVYVSL